MEFALTTRWNAGRHSSGEAMVEEILELGFTHIELGYDTRMDLVPGIENMVEQGAVTVTSLHNFCPLPMGAPHGHPELYTFANTNRHIRQNAIHYTKQTVEFAARVGAKAIVVHAGYVETRKSTSQLLDLVVTGKLYTPAYDKQKMKLAVERDKKAPRFVAWMYECMEAMLPTLEEYQVAIGLENLPTWEALPSETEIEALCNHFDSPYVRAWWDMGHAQIRENLGYINHERWMTKLHPLIVGLHVHDVSHKIADHTMPPLGEIDFSRFATLGARPDLIRVIEPTTKTPAHEIAEAHTLLRAAWFDEHAETDNLPPAPPGESAEASTGTESENKTPTEQA